ncbi:SDR family oxidoreductase [Pseudomonadota bacterium]
MKKKLLITGGSGLLAVNWACSARDKFAVNLAMHDRKITLPGVDTLPFSLDSVGGVVAALREISPDYVVHTAGLTNVDLCEKEPELARYINAELAGNVAKACGDVGVQLAHISTDHLFAGDQEMLEENNPLQPVNMYGKTKAEGEEQVLDVNPEALVVRTNFYGWGTSYRQSFSDMIIGTLKKQGELNLFDDVFYTPILADVLARTVLDLLSMKASGVYHVVGDDRVSKYQFGIEVAERFGFDLSLINRSKLTSISTLTRRPADMSLSNAKLCRALGRDVGGVKEHLNLLYQQQESGLAEVIQSL